VTEPTHYRVAREAHETAGKLVQGDRRETHGDFARNFATIAELWTGYLHASRPSVQITIGSEDVAHMMTLMKIGRTLNGSYNPDDYVDAIGYGMIAAGLAGRHAEEAG